MKITGGRDYIKFDMENGCVLKANGEMLTDHSFVVYKDTMKTWITPTGEVSATEEDVLGIIDAVNKKNGTGAMQIIFE